MSLLQTKASLSWVNMTFVCSLLAFYSVKNVMIFSFCCCNLSRLTEQGDFLREFFVYMFEMKQTLFIKPFPMRITLSEHKLGFQMRMKNMPRNRQELPLLKTLVYQTGYHFWDAFGYCGWMFFCSRSIPLATLRIGKILYPQNWG